MANYSRTNTNRFYWASLEAPEGGIMMKLFSAWSRKEAVTQLLQAYPGYRIVTLHDESQMTPQELEQLL